MNSLRIRSAIVLAAPLLPLAPLGAQTAPDPIVTDRPSESAGPSVVSRFALQIEAGYKFSRFDQGEKRTDTQQLPDLLLRFGAFERIEARLTMTGFSFKNEGSPEARRKEDGFNDVSIGAKWALVNEQGRRPAVSLLGDLNLPVGDAEFTDDFVNPKLLVLFSSTLDRLSLTYNVGPSFIRLEKEGRERTVVDLPYTLMLSGPVADGAGWFAELFGAFALSDARMDRHSAQAGATYVVGPSFQLDVRAGLGLIENVPDWLVGAGIGVRLPH